MLKKGVQFILSEEEKRKILGKMPCVHLDTCEGPPQCYAYHPPDADIPANRKKVAVLQTKPRPQQENQVSSEDTDLQTALERSLTDTHAALVNSTCNLCHQQFKNVDELQVHTLSECKAIYGDAHHPVLVSHEETVTNDNQSDEEEDAYSDEYSADSYDESESDLEEQGIPPTVVETTGHIKCDTCQIWTLSWISCMFCQHNLCGSCTGLPAPEPGSDVCRIINAVCESDVTVILCLQCRKILENSHEELVIAERSSIHASSEQLSALKAQVTSLQIELQKLQSENCQLKGISSKPSFLHKNSLDSESTSNSLSTTIDQVNDVVESEPEPIIKPPVVRSGDVPSTTCTGDEAPEIQETSKNVTLHAEIKALQKMLLLKNRPEGPISISGRASNHSSINVELNCALMEILHPKLATELKESYPEITELTEVKRVKVCESSKGELDSEVHYDVSFMASGSLMKVRMKVYIRRCKIQIQSCGQRNKFIEKMKIGHAEYFATKFLDCFAKKTLEANPNYHEQTVKQLEINLKTLQNTLSNSDSGCKLVGETEVVDIASI